MATTKAEISGWFDTGIEYGDAFLIIVCDTFDHDNYPVFVADKKSFWKKYNEYDNKNMQKIMEVYDLSLDKNKQLDKQRCWSFPEKE